MGHNNTNFESEQTNKLQKFGLHLGQVRQERGTSLKAIAQQTQIPLRLLNAMEAGRIEELPEPFYIKALLEKYARALNLSAEELQEFKVATSSQKTAKNSTSGWRLSLPQLRSIHLYLVYVALVIVGVQLMTKLVETPVAIDPVAKKPSEESSSITIGDRSPNSSPSVPIAQIQSPPDSKQPVTVDVTLKERCWLKVTIDGKPEFEGTLPAGTNRTWVGDRQVTLVAGNAGGVFITFNNGQEQLLGRPGQVEEVTYTVN